MMPIDERKPAILLAGCENAGSVCFLGKSLWLPGNFIEKQNHKLLFILLSLARFLGNQTKVEIPSSEEKKKVTKEKQKKNHQN